jgi:hypothetical protein
MKTSPAIYCQEEALVAKGDRYSSIEFPHEWVQRGSIYSDFVIKPILWCTGCGKRIIPNSRTAISMELELKRANIQKNCDWICGIMRN